MTSHCITIEETGEQFACGEDRPVLLAMAALGRRGIPVGCVGGGCGVCKVQVTHGEYWCKRMSREHVSAQEEQGGAVLACRAYPRTALRMRVIGKLRKSIVQAFAGSTRQ